MRIHEERDALQAKVERMGADMRELERERDELRERGARGSADGGQAREDVALLERERELLREEYEAEIA